jgi:hypothetical protein
MVTSADVEAIVMQLERNAGAHAHTAGKARNYLRKFAREAEENPEAFKDGSLDSFVALVRGAAYRGEWEALDKRMAKWW